LLVSVPGDAFTFRELFLYDRLALAEFQWIAVEREALNIGELRLGGNMEKDFASPLFAGWGAG
jgi:hypothetical protein